ncbi:uncharacterized protein LOC126768679 [Nymphalis io]|uniref:uncharacterized protein LOC126768679 n=1 Tax=Inachis io TaxID=171585 RepID=UPI002169B9C7|nr:uncharacterized protein LOC126768679 [Nymphalis io]
MAKLLAVLVILGKIYLSIQQEDHFVDDSIKHQPSVEENPNYSFGYGVSDTHTGDVKTVWEAKQGDTVKGHYSVIEPDGSMRTVEYSAGPNSGFTATVNNDGLHNKPIADADIMEDKVLRDYDRYYDFSEDTDIEQSYKGSERKRNRHPYESLFKDYSLMKRPKYPTDLEPSEYTHSFSIKHPHEDLDSDATAYSHVGLKFDPNCKTKHKKKNNLYTNVDLDFRRQKYPSLTSDSYNNGFDKYVGDSSNMEKLIQMYKQNEQYKPSKPEEYNSWSSTKNGHQGLSDLQLEDTYSDYIPPRPKKKYKPHKTPELFESEDLDDYVLVPKKKHKKPFRAVESSEYQPDMDEAYDDNYDDDRYHKPPRGNHKEVVRKIVKKKKPAINILDIFDI